MKLWLPFVLLLPSLAFAESPFAGTWTVQPELTSLGGHSLELLIDRGAYQLKGCRKPLTVAAEGADHVVEDQPLFDAMSVRVVDPRRVEIVQKRASKVAWKGTYAVAKDGRSMALAFEDDRPANAVSGIVQYVREGDPIPQAHALSGTWRPDKITRLSASGSTLTIEDKGDGLAMTWSDGRSVESKLNASYFPLHGYLDGARVSILRSRPDTLAINRLQGIVPVEVSRAVISEDGETLSFRQVDWICESMITFTYRRKSQH
jgi:hypothetical protein